jgi:uncharacterized protein with PIN domain
MEAKKRAFLLDRMLGKLCTKMRMLGLDAKLNPEGEDGRFFLNAAREGRIPVTRARDSRDRPGPKPIILQSGDAFEQIAELFAALGETPQFDPFSRCIVDNVPLVEVPASAVKGQVPPYVAKTFTRYHRCPECKRIYWEGTHFREMAEQVKRIEERIRKKS